MATLLANPITRASLFGLIAPPAPTVSKLVRGRAMHDHEDDSPVSAVAPEPEAMTPAAGQVLEELRKGPATLYDLVVALNGRATRKAISMALMRLVRAGKVRAGDVVTSGGGRPAALFHLIEETV